MSKFVCIAAVIVGWPVVTIIDAYIVSYVSINNGPHAAIFNQVLSMSASIFAVFLTAIYFGILVALMMNFWSE